MNYIRTYRRTSSDCNVHTIEGNTIMSCTYLCIYVRMLSACTHIRKYVCTYATKNIGQV